MLKKKSKKKPKNKNWNVVGYYVDVTGSYTLLEHKKDRSKNKTVKGI